MSEFWKKYWRWIIGIGLVYLYPFYGLLIGMIPWVNWPPLLTFGLDLKDFMTVWIALGGVIAVVVGIFQTQKRISQQEKQQRDARFAASVELLGNNHESTRIGGAYNLYFLAREHKEYINPVCEILCAHLRTITNNIDYQERYQNKPSNEVGTIMNLLLVRQENNVSLFNNMPKNLSGVYLSGVNISFGKVKIINYVNFSNAIITNSDFHGVEFTNTYFEGATLQNINFFGTKFERVNFRKAILNDNDFVQAKLHFVDFSGAELTGCVFLRAKLNIVSFMVFLGFFYEDAKLTGNQKFTKLHNVIFSDAKEFEHVDFSTAKLTGQVNFSGTRLQRFTNEEIVKPDFSLEQTKDANGVSKSMGGLSIF